MAMGSSAAAATHRMKVARSWCRRRRVLSARSPLSDQVAVESREETMVDFPHNTGSRWWLLAMEGCYVGGGSG